MTDREQQSFEQLCRLEDNLWKQYKLKSRPSGQLYCYLLCELAAQIIAEAVKFNAKIREQLETENRHMLNNAIDLAAQTMSREGVRYTLEG